jgi:hypothetical protein
MFGKILSVAEIRDKINNEERTALNGKAEPLAEELHEILLWALMKNQDPEEVIGAFYRALVILRDHHLSGSICNLQELVALFVRQYSREHPQGLTSMGSCLRPLLQEIPVTRGYLQSLGVPKVMVEFAPSS